MAGLLTVQTLVFSLPGTFIGLIVMILLLYGIKIAVYDSMRFPLLMDIDASTIALVSEVSIDIIGCTLGYLCPSLLKHWSNAISNRYILAGRSGHLPSEEGR